MLYTQDRNKLRQFLLDAWQKYRSSQPMEPLENMIAQVIAQHPEYHVLFEGGEKSLGKDFIPENGETNPFLHISMHLAVAEQLSIDKPQGIRGLYSKGVMKFGDAHNVEHMMMDCIAESIWQAQRNGVAPDEQNYADCLRNRLK